MKSFKEFSDFISSNSEYRVATIERADSTRIENYIGSAILLTLISSEDIKIAILAAEVNVMLKKLADITGIEYSALLEKFGEPENKKL